jgi:hypothetical protein
MRRQVGNPRRSLGLRALHQCAIIPQPIAFSDELNVHLSLENATQPAPYQAAVVNDEPPHHRRPFTTQGLPRRQAKLVPARSWESVKLRLVSRTALPLSRS